jgi:uncharacterized protein
MNDEEMAALLAQAQQVALSGKYELFKTTLHFDETARHPDWLEPDTPPSAGTCP